MNRYQLIEKLYTKASYLCVGLDTDPEKLPPHLKGSPDAVLQFNRQIIDATKPYCISYKINTAFYEAQGVRGWEILQQTAEYIGDSHFKIADAKRGDIGNTSAQYARAFFERMNFDAITVAPYMGEDSLRPFLDYKDKWTIVLGLTSNSGARDFELQKTGEDYLYEKVLKTVSGWGTPDNLMFVIGATQAEEFINIRQLTPHHFYLVPGIGAQGGSLQQISEKALNRDGGLLVAASRAVIYASSGEDFAERAEAVAKAYRDEMAGYLDAFEKVPVRENQ